MMETLGEAATKQAQKYFEIYKKFKNESDIGLSSKAEELAFHDLYDDKLIAEFAIDKLKELIKQYKQK